ncbi:MAG TPA: tyrosine recombinase XerC [Candidatus Flavonifractor intestinipullorum]|uniref:Tyrosine recombinase XerC n=1 Tax=Candidatus Flavonifractor intestinipullorum TaxID=2838587 RepID=A0A9D2S589_9FIRM|nr:tyrosine recombinase XerC [Candidatus Flavonifractor intestinipullorum]
MDYRTEAPEMIRAFLTYHRTIQGHSIKTVDEYYLDLRTFFRFIKQLKGRAPTGPDVDFESIPIDDVDLDLAGSVTLSDVYAFMDYLDRDRSLNAASRARKVATIRSFYKYLTSKAKLLRDNPMQDLDAPRLKKTLPRYLQLDQCIQLLESVDEPNRARDYCILTLFLNCGLRISELVALNVTDVRENQIRILGKGNKERILFLNDACRAALDDWLEERSHQAAADPNALFLTRSHTRMTRDAVHYMVKQRLKKAGLDSTLYSSHKLRHTAATLMLQNGVDVRTLQEVLGHENLNTTQIYTHVDSENLRTAAKANPLAKVRPRKKQPEHASSAEESGQTSPEK